MTHDSVTLHPAQHHHPQNPFSMDLRRLNPMVDYNTADPKEEAKPSGATEERLDSGLDSLKDEEYQAVAAELTQLRVDCSAAQRQHQQQQQQQQAPLTGEQHASRKTETRQADVCECLLLAGADPTVVDDRGDTALHIACRGGSLTCFSVLTQNCPSEQLKKVVSTCNYKGMNCLHLSCVQGFLSLVESLVSLGANINAQEQCNGRSALHLAVDLQKLSLVRLLLRGGADPNHLSYGGFSPYHLTFGRHDDDIKNTLYPLTDPSLRELPDSEPEDSEDEGGREEEEGQTDEEVGYDDIQWNGH
ncbi:hypothetical protein CRUP_034330 [Coryphaenoides rupestris]|nr:hypothetical protein CRUP_034330 [Coryphaenoides rupestris]